MNHSGNTTPSTHHFLPKHGHYKGLRVYRLAENIYDITFMFCKRFLPNYGDRTVDQMVQAARSGKQNIAEGNQAASTSSETEIKLTNVAKASFEELLADYEDYLRTRNLPQWGLNHERMNALRNWTRSINFYQECVTKAQKMSDEEIANLGITLCHQAIFMLHRLIETQQERFVSQGGIKERMHAARTGYRQTHDAQLARLKQENEQQQTRIKELEARIKELEARIKELEAPHNPTATHSNQSTQSTLNTLNTLNTPSNLSNPSTPSTPSNLSNLSNPSNPSNRKNQQS